MKCINLLSVPCIRSLVNPKITQKRSLTKAAHIIMDKFKEFAKISDSRIDELSEDLNELSLKIWNKPETQYQETFAHELLTETLKKHGFDVTPQFTLPTAFRASYELNGDGKGLTAGIICEYDALPEIGHACGHNLIAEAGIAAGLGLLNPSVIIQLFALHE